MSSPSTHPSVKSDTVLMATYYQKANNLYHPHHASYGGATGAEVQPATFHHQISPYGLDATTTSYSHTYQTHPVVHHAQSHYSPTLQNQMNWPQIAAHRYSQMAGPANMTAHLADYNNRLFSHGSNSILPASAETSTSSNPNTNPHRNIRQSINPVTTYPEWLTTATTGNSHQQAITITSTSGLRTADSTPNNDARLIDVHSDSMQTTLVSQQDHQVLPASQKNPNGIRINHSLHAHRYPSPVFHRTCMDQSPPPPPNPHNDYLPPTPSGTDLQSNSLSNSPAESFSDISLSTSDLVQALPQQPSIHPSLQHHPSLLHNTCHQLNRLNSPIVSTPSNGAYLHLPHHLALDRSGSNDEGLCSSDPDSSSPNPSMNGCRAPYDWMRSAQMDNTSKIRKAGRTRTKDKYRVVYSDYQRLELEKEFHCSFYINVIRKAELAQELGLSQRQIKIWFQNRRAKDRKLRQREMDKGHIKCETGLNDSSLSVECLSPSTNSPHQLSGEENITS